MSGGDWGLVGLGGSKHGTQSLTFFFFFKLVERYKSIDECVKDQQLV